MKQIICKAFWHSGEVRDFCMKNGYYRNGTVYDYSKMLQKVDASKPTPGMLYEIATDIYNHSDRVMSVESFMHYLDAETVWRSYEVNDDGDSEGSDTGSTEDERVHETEGVQDAGHHDEDADGEI